MPGGGIVELRAAARARPALGIKYQLAVDGMSLLVVLLTSIIIFAGSFASWTVKERSQEFYALLLVLVTGVYDVVVSLDLFVLFLFEEIAVLPMYLLIRIRGSSGEVRPQGLFGVAMRRTGVGSKEYASMKLTRYLLPTGKAIRSLPTLKRQKRGAGLHERAHA